MRNKMLVALYALRRAVILFAPALTVRPPLALEVTGEPAGDEGESLGDAENELIDRTFASMSCL